MSQWQDGFSKSSNGGLLCQGHLWVPAMKELKNEILTKAHKSPFSMHPSDIKMYQDLKQHFWWRSMKKDIGEFVSKYMECWQVKHLNKTLQYAGMEMRENSYGFHSKISQDV